MGTYAAHKKKGTYAAHKKTVSYTAHGNMSKLQGLWSACGGVSTYDDSCPPTAEWQVSERPFLLLKDYSFSAAAVNADFDWFRKGNVPEEL
jgi:hypothetical protein